MTGTGKEVEMSASFRGDCLDFFKKERRRDTAYYRINGTIRQTTGSLWEEHQQISTLLATDNVGTG